MYKTKSECKMIMLYVKVIASDGELNSSKSLKEAADVISSSQAGLQLR